MPVFRSFLRWLAVGFALLAAAPLAAAQSTPMTWYRNERALMILNHCPTDGRYVLNVQTPAWGIGDQPLDRWFLQSINQHMFTWSEATVPDPPIRMSGDVMTAQLRFTAHNGTVWRAFFAGVGRPDNRAEWSVILAPNSVPETDRFWSTYRDELVRDYQNGATIMPEQLEGRRGGVPERTRSASQEIVGRLRTTSLRYVWGGRLNHEPRTFLLMKDGFVLQVTEDERTFFSIGKWRKDGVNYRLDWGTGEEDSVSEQCFQAPAPPPKPAAAPPTPKTTSGTGKKSCKMVPREITTFNNQRVCDMRGQNCTLQSVPTRRTVMQEECT